MPTVSFLKNALQGQIAPGNDEEFLRLLQEADIRLLEYGKWRWTRSRIPVTPVDGIVTLPVTHVSILGAQLGRRALDIRAEEFEFMPDGLGEVPVDGGGGAYLIDQGVDTNGQRIYKLTSHLPENPELSLICHKAPLTLYDPDSPDSDIPEGAVDSTICPDMAALKLVMFSINYEERDDMGRSRDYFQTALRTLEAKEKAQRGNARQQLNIRPNGIGVSGIRSFR